MSKLQERDVLLEPWFSVRINGRDFQEDMLKYVSSVEINDEEESYSELIITVEDYDRKWMNGFSINKDSKIVVKMGHVKNNSVAFEGRITIIDADYPENGVGTLTIYAVDSGIGLTVERKSKVFKNKKISDVIKALHTEVGVKITVEDSKTVLKHVPLTDESYAEFTHRWRKQLGWKYYKKPDGSYYFGSKDMNIYPTEALSYMEGGLEIVSFTPTYVDAETEDLDKDTQIENKNANTKQSSGSKNSPKVKSSGSHKTVGKA